jgi:hypothetical protein
LGLAVASLIKYHLLLLLRWMILHFQHLPRLPCASFFPVEVAWSRWLLASRRIVR